MFRRRTAAIGVASLVMCATTWGQTTQKRVVRTPEDLPARMYKVAGTPLAILRDDAACKALAATVVADLHEDLDRCDVQSDQTLALADLLFARDAVTRGDFDAALAFADQVEAVPHLSKAHAVVGITFRATVTALRGVGNDRSKYPAAYADALRPLAEQLPLDDVRRTVFNAMSVAKKSTPDTFEPAVMGAFGADFGSNPEGISRRDAIRLIGLKYTHDYIDPVAPQTAAVFSALLKAHPPKDFWTPRRVSLQEDAKATPVVIGVWDAGVDSSQFPGRLWNNPDPAAKGASLHGIAFGRDHTLTNDELEPLVELRLDVKSLLNSIQADSDRTDCVDTPAIDQADAFFKSLPPDRRDEFADEERLVSQWCHGTRVAGVVADGNPFIRLYLARQDFEVHQVPVMPPTVEEFRTWGESLERTVALFRQSGARVVNMSWDMTRDEVIAMLKASGVGADDKERDELAATMVAQYVKGLDRALRSAPEILFVTSAGKTGPSLDTAEAYPYRLKLPNVLSIGATDASDVPADFNGIGENVFLYADGVQVETVLPGGGKMRSSGTSIAAPQVTNAAAKMLALRPQLTVAEVITILKETADPLPGEPGHLIVNPKHAVERATTMPANG